jgi:uncharacterized repeat protein (TIGR03803 family)
MKETPRLVAIATLMLLVGTAGAVYSQTFSPLYNLGTNSGDPAYPTWPGLFAQPRDGNLYSTSTNGGAHGYGAVFQLTPTGKMTVLHSFTGADSNTGDGGYPYGGLTLGTDGSLYGTTVRGGVGYGTVFKITTGGTFNVLHSFNGTNEGTAWYDTAAPIQGTDGNFYGTVSDGTWNYGTVYKMTPSGSLTVLYQFGIGGSTLRYPYALIQGTDGNFYGTCGYANGHSYGAVFKITPHGELTVLHAFNGTDGWEPYGAIIQASDGNFYGTTKFGGSGSYGVIWRLTPAAVFKVLFNFSTYSLGLYPMAGLVQATDGKFYGATYGGGSGYGVLFQVTSTGSYSVLYRFPSASVGAHPEVSLFQHTNGTFYGDTYEGGTGGPGCSGGCGILYSLKMGLGPFVSLLPYSGKVGNTIEFLGQGFTGTTEVSFSGTAASFHVVSDTYLTATVPSGAKTGLVTVTTTGRTLVSNKTFRVTPQITSFDPTSGPVGTSVTITGVNLAQTTQVTFNGLRATFTVDSDTQVTATVPSGATTGKIAITTPGGTATSATNFTVT